MPRVLSAEFMLLVACCRWPSSPAVRDRIARAVAHVDWPRFVTLARRHRVEGIAWKALQDAGVVPAIPADAAAALSGAAGGILRQNLLIAGESVQLSRLLDRASVPHMFVKGVTLGQLAYGDIGRKAGWDIDLLIDPADLDDAAAVLRDRGYRLDTPDPHLAAGKLSVWHLYSKESVWRNAAGTLWVELHTALTDNPLLLPGIGVRSPARAVEVSPGLALPTLAGDELFAYLCVHGASSAWFRLKWIADLAALIGAEPPAEVERLYRRAVALGAGRAAALGLLLARRLFRTPMSPDLRRELGADRVTRWMVAMALRKLAGRAGASELGEVAMGTASIHAVQFGLLPGWRFKRAELARQLVSPIDRVATPLPRGFAWLYPALQAARLVRGKAGA